MCSSMIDALVNYASLIIAKLRAMKQGHYSVERVEKKVQPPVFISIENGRWEYRKI